MKNKIVLLLVMVLFSTGLLFAQEKGKGRKAPPFEVTSGDHKTMNLAGLKPWQVIICFYETSDVVELNKDFKDELQALYGRMDEATRKKLFILSVGDCSKAKWPFVGLWESALVDRSEKLGWTIYGDWSGQMRDDYRFVPDDSNFAIIDSNGMILYQVSGKIGLEETKLIEEFILSLLAG